MGLNKEFGVFLDCILHINLIYADLEFDFHNVQWINLCTNCIAGHGPIAQFCIWIKEIIFPYSSAAVK